MNEFIHDEKKGPTVPNPFDPKDPEQAHAHAEWEDKTRVEVQEAQMHGILDKENGLVPKSNPEDDPNQN